MCGTNGKCGPCAAKGGCGMKSGAKEVTPFMAKMRIQVAAKAGKKKEVESPAEEKSKGEEKDPRKAAIGRKLASKR